MGESGDLLCPVSELINGYLGTAKTATVVNADRLC